MNLKWIIRRESFTLSRSVMVISKILTLEMVMNLKRESCVLELDSFSFFPLSPLREFVCKNWETNAIIDIMWKCKPECKQTAAAFSRRGKNDGAERNLLMYPFWSSTSYEYKIKKENRFWTVCWDLTEWRKEKTEI